MSQEINISNLTVGYDKKSVLSDVNLNSTNQQLIAIIGLNGKGKSTLIKTLAGILPAISGKFNYSGNDIFAIDEKERSKIFGLVSTEQPKIENILVKDYISFGRYPYSNWLGITDDKDEDKINFALDLCKLKDLINRDYNELSDGEKQKVNIARVLAQDTELIILDEPTTHLDLINKIELLKLLKDLVNNHSKTVVFSTHMVEYALQLADEIWLVDSGTVKKYTPKELIVENAFKKLFCGELLSFNTQEMTFKLK